MDDGPSIVLLLIVLLVFGLWIWSLVHCILNSKISAGSKIACLLAIIFLGLLGSLLYVFLAGGDGGRSTRRSRRRGGSAKPRGGSARTRGDGPRARSNDARGRSNNPRDKSRRGGTERVARNNPRSPARGRRRR